MRKSHRLVVGLGALLALGAACNDEFLTEVPSDFVAPENFYRNEGDALAAVNAAYASFINLSSPLGSSDYVGRNFWMVAEYPTEVVTSRLSAENERSLFGGFHTDMSSSHPYLEGIWQAAYSGINRANSVIARVPAVPMDEERRDQIVAEAKFLRALHYYWLAGLFGGVPLKIEETRSIDGGLLPRAPVEDVWAQVEQDLTEAAEVLPPSWPADQFGRATRGAALTLLGKAQLHSAATVPSLNGNYQKAEQTFRQVLTLGYTLDGNYASLFRGTNERSAEIIFSLQNIRLDGYGGRISEWFSPRTSPEVYPGGAQGQFQAERPFFDSAYVATDVRKAGTWLLSFLHPNGTTQTWTWTSSPNPTGSARYGSTGPVPSKYLDWQAADAGAEEPDVIILRYADVLLSLAEAINAQAGPTTEAYGFVNQVRGRANAGVLAPGLAAQAFEDSLYVERRRELALEMHGIFDMRRNWPFAKSRVERHMSQRAALNRSPFTSSVEKFDARPIPDKWILYPIPLRACELNKELTQNPGWDEGVCLPSGTTGT